MGREPLAHGYRHVVNTIYSPKQYYERIKTFLKEYKPRNKGKSKISLLKLLALIRSTWALGFKEKGRIHYWKLVIWTLLRKPKTFSLSVTLAIQGFHFRKVAEKVRVSLASDTRKLELLKDHIGKHN
jgi:hypothetical protein